MRHSPASMPNVTTTSGLVDVRSNTGHRLASLEGVIMPLFARQTITVTSFSIFHDFARISGFAIFDNKKTKRHLGKCKQVLAACEYVWDVCMWNVRTKCFYGFDSAVQQFFDKIGKNRFSDPEFFFRTFRVPTAQTCLPRFNKAIWDV